MVSKKKILCVKNSQWSFSCLIFVFFCFLRQVILRLQTVLFLKTIFCSSISNCALATWLWDSAAHVFDSMRNIYEKPAQWHVMPVCFAHKKNTWAADSHNQVAKAQLAHNQVAKAQLDILGICPPNLNGFHTYGTISLGLCILQLSGAPGDELENIEKYLKKN